MSSPDDSDLDQNKLWYCYLIMSLSATQLLVILTVVIRTKFSRTKLVNRLTMVPFYSLIAYTIVLLLQMLLISQKIAYDNNFLLITEILKSLKAIAVYLVGSSQTLEWLCLCQLL